MRTKIPEAWNSKRTGVVNHMRFNFGVVSRSKRLGLISRGLHRNRDRDRIPYRCGFSCPEFDCDPDSDPDPDRYCADCADNYWLAAKHNDSSLFHIAFGLISNAS
jgi:hypothetical protein